MLFSIIIATAGRPERLSRTLQLTAEAIRVSGSDHRIIVVDNHPEYTSSAVVETFAASFHGVVKYLKTPPRDKSQALNAGIAAADTEWLAFTDDDTLPSSDWLVQAALFAGRSGVRVFAGQIVSDDTKCMLPGWMKPGKSGRVPAIGGAIVQYAPLPASGKLRVVDPVPYGANVFVRRDVFETFGGYDETLWALSGKAALGVEDGEFGIRLKNAGEPIWYCREASVVHPVHYDRCRIGIQLRLAFYYGWRDPIVFFDADRPLLEPYRLRLIAGYGWGWAKNALLGDKAASIADLILLARSLGHVFCRLSPAYRRRSRAVLLADKVPKGSPSGQKAWMCPQCGSESLGLRQEQLCCDVCGKQYPIANGIPLFSDRKDFYWGELPREKMRTLLSSGAATDHQLNELLGTLDPDLSAYLRQYAIDPTRAGWKYVTALPREGIALDFGCGWGALTLSLADSMQSVVAADLIPERVEMTVRRAREAGFTQVKGCVTAGVPRLPFPDQTFDLVVVNGVLEWLPEAFRENPKDIQQQFLREVSRVLKVSGQVYIGIENRFGALYFVGRPEEHTKLPFISLLPRWLGRLYHRIALGRPYRAYTHGREALVVMLRRAGLKQAKFYIPYPDYREFTRIIDPDSEKWFKGSFAPRSRIGMAALWLMTRVPSSWRLMASFAIVAGRERADSALKRITDALMAGGILPPTAEVRSYRLTRTGAVQVVYAQDKDETRRPQNGGNTVGDTSTILTLPLCPAARKQIQTSVEIRRAIVATLQAANCELPGIDAPIAAGQIEGVEYKLDRFSFGTAWPKGVADDAFLETCLVWLGQFHVAVNRRAPFRDAATTGVDMAEAMLVERMPVEAREAWKRCREVLQDADSVVQTMVHGDFHRGNILFDHSRQVDVVIDWDLATLAGLPVWDVMTLLCVDEFNRSGVWSKAYKRAADLCLGQMAGAGPIHQYYQHLALRRQDIWYAILTFPFIQLRNKLTVGIDRRESVILDGLPEVFTEMVRSAYGELATSKSDVDPA